MEGRRYIAHGHWSETSSCRCLVFVSVVCDNFHPLSRSLSQAKERLWSFCPWYFYLSLSLSLSPSLSLSFFRKMKKEMNNSLFVSVLSCTGSKRKVFRHWCWRQFSQDLELRIIHSSTNAARPWSGCHWFVLYLSLSFSTIHLSLSFTLSVSHENLQGHRSFWYSCCIIFARLLRSRLWAANCNHSSFSSLLSYTSLSHDNNQKQGKLLSVIKAHASSISSISFAPKLINSGTAAVLLSAGFDGFCRLWRITILTGTLFLLSLSLSVSLPLSLYLFRKKNAQAMPATRLCLIASDTTKWLEVRHNFFSFVFFFTLISLHTLTHISILSPLWNQPRFHLRWITLLRPTRIELCEFGTFPSYEQVKIVAIGLRKSIVPDYWDTRISSVRYFFFLALLLPFVWQTCLNNLPVFLYRLSLATAATFFSLQQQKKMVHCVSGRKRKARMPPISLIRQPVTRVAGIVDRWWECLRDIHLLQPKLLLWLVVGRLMISMWLPLRTTLTLLSFLQRKAVFSIFSPSTRILYHTYLLQFFFFGFHSNQRTAQTDPIIHIISYFISCILFIYLFFDCRYML